MSELSSANKALTSTENAKDSDDVGEKTSNIYGCPRQILDPSTPDSGFDVPYGYSSTKFEVIRKPIFA